MQDVIRDLLVVTIFFYSFEALAAVFGWMKRSAKAIK